MIRRGGLVGSLAVALSGCATTSNLPVVDQPFDREDSVAFVAGVEGRVATFSDLCGSSTWPFEIADYKVGALDDPFLAPPECYRMRLDTLARSGRCAEAGLELVVIGSGCSALDANHPCCPELHRRPERLFRAWSGNTAATDSLRLAADPAELRWWDPQGYAAWFQRSWDSALLDGGDRLTRSPPVPFPDDSASIAIDLAFTKLLNVTKAGVHLAFVPRTSKEEFFCRVLNRGLVARGIPWRACRDRSEMDSISSSHGRMRSDSSR